MNISNHSRRETKQPNKQPGFSLLEVLITVVILAIGLLGLAGLQTSGLKNNHSAYQRSQATLLAYDMIDRVRANKNIADNYLFAFMEPADATAIANCHKIVGCSADLMAENDLFEWNETLAANLPAGAGTITSAGTTFTITITWDDDRDGNDANNPTFQTSFQP